MGLKALTSVQADFRANDRDGNRVNDFWTGDLSSLHFFKVDGRELQLIPREMAEADARPLRPLAGGPVACHGYFFVAMDRDESNPPGEDYRLDTDGSGRKVHNTSRFGFCAYPERYGGTGEYTFIVNENNIIFRFDNGGKPILAWPCDQVFRDLWGEMD